jgi:ribosomal protein S12 methylthiotransferase
MNMPRPDKTVIGSFCASLNGLKVFFITLGCDKNRVDGEVMTGTLSEAGFILTPNAKEADAIIVNTCGFIRDAVQESIETILELAEHKKTSRCRVLVVAGCMAQRYRDEILKEITEADAVIGVTDYLTCVQVVHKLLEQSTAAPGILLTEADIIRCRIAGRSANNNPHTAYVKIAEGCDNRCTYCTIPSIRGVYISRPFDDIADECRRLAETGAKELILVAQDTARYGTDVYGKPRLHELLREITRIPGLTWVRLMYANPEHITPELLQALALPKMAPYLDMPVQHSQNDVLKRMGRKSTRAGLIRLIKEIRAAVPGIAIRTTILTGFPGETEEAFNELCEFLKEIKFERLGVFGYSPEDGTPAARMKELIKPDEIQARRDKLMRLQQEIHIVKQKNLIGEMIDVMTDTVNEDGSYTGRSPWDAPEVDCVVTFTAMAGIVPGQLVRVLVTQADEYDLCGKAV